MDRVLQGTQVTIQVQMYFGGELEDPIPDTATVRVVRADGTELVASTPAINAGTGLFQHVLTPTHTSLLDTLTAYWTATFDGLPQTVTTTVEVAGGVLFTIAELRAMSTVLANTTNYPTSDLIQMRTTVEDALESELGYALVPRYTRASCSARPGGYLRLKPYPRAIRSVVSGGTTLSAASISGLRFSSAGFVSGYSWTDPTVIGYEHGLDRPSGRMKRAGLQLAKLWLVASPVDDRASTFTSVDGGTYSLMVEGRGGSIFGDPTVDGAVKAERLIPAA